MAIDARRVGIMTIASLRAAQPDQIDHPCGASHVDAGFAGRDGDLRFAVVVIEMKRDHTIEQGVLGAIDAAYSRRVRREDGAKIRMDVDITFASAVQRGNVQHALRQDAQERVVGLRPAPLNSS